MTESEKKEMIDTVRERVGIEMDLPENGWYWDWYQALEGDRLKEVDAIIDATILKTAQYLQPQNEAWT